MPRGKKAKRPRRKWGELEQCFKCPREHPGWKRSVLRVRKGTPLCPEHKKQYDANRQPSWPNCPSCGGDEFGAMRWNGSVEKTTAYCDDCDFEGKALDHFDKHTVKNIAAPIDWARNNPPGEKRLIT